MSRQNLIWVHAALDDAGLSPYAFRVYARIARRAGPNGTCYESADNMAEGCDMSRRQLFRSIEELMSKGLIKKVSRPGQTTVYQLSPIGDKKERPVPHRHTPRASQAHEVHPKKEKTTEAKASVSPPEPEEKKAREKGPRKPTPVGILIGNTIKAWNAERHDSWPELKRITGRGAKYVKEFLAYFDGDYGLASERMRMAIRYAVKHEDWWRDKGTVSFDELAANNKLEGYSDKALARSREQGRKSEEGSEGGNTPGGGIEPLRVRTTHGWFAILKHKELNRYWAEYEESDLETPPNGW